MSDKRGFSIGYKLALLAVVPVIGALLLSGIIVRDASRQAEAAAALGSVEDLAVLASKISTSVHQLQGERALLSLHFGQPVDAQRTAAYEASDKAIADLQSFLEHRDMTRLPQRLVRDLNAARSLLNELKAQRSQAAAEGGDLVKTLDFYAQTDKSLIRAIAALMQLSEEGELLRAISSLASVLQFKESASQEHAVLANVFQHNAFGPGVYKLLVTLVTEQAVDERVFRQNATDDTQDLFDRALRGDVLKSSIAMRQKALDATDNDFGISSEDWMRFQGRKIDSLRGLENVLVERVRKVALQKTKRTRSDLTTRLSLASGALLASIVLAVLIGRASRVRSPA